MINISHYKNISHDINYLQNAVIFSNAKEITVKLIQIIEDALVDDTSLRTWCNTNYSRKQTVYSGLDKRYPPGEANTPYASVSTIEESAGYGLPENAFGIGIVCAISDDTLTTTEDTSGVTYKKYRGMENAESMRKLVETATLNVIDSNSDLSGALVDMINISYRTFGYFPFFYSNTMFTIKYIYCCGDAVFENRK